MKHLTAEPDLSKIPDGFRAVIERSLYKDSELRYRNVMEMCADLPWSDVAANSQQIGRRHAIGPIRSQPTGVDAVQAVESPAEHQPIPVSRDTRSVSGKATPSPGALANRGENSQPFVINEEVANRAVQSFVLMQQRIQNGLPLGTDGNRIQAINAAEIVFSGDAAEPTGNLPREPIARAVHQGVADIRTWWQGLDWSTPWKVAVLVAGTLVLVLNSTWLLPVALVLGLVYLIYFGIRSFFVPADHEWRPPGNAVVTAPSLHSTWPGQPASTPHSVVRTAPQWNTAPMSSWLEQLQSWLTSCLVAAVACCLFSLLGLIIGGNEIRPSYETIALFGWTVGVSTLASWSLLGLGKLWEYREGDRLFRRFVSLGTGVALGIVAFGLANGLMIETQLLGVARQHPLLANVSEDQTGLAQSLWQSVLYFPLLSSFMMAYGALFAVLRWWKLAAPDRRARISLFGSGLCLIAAVACAEVFDLNKISLVVVAGVTALAVQLAAPSAVVIAPSAELVALGNTHYRPANKVR